MPYTSQFIASLQHNLPVIRIGQHLGWLKWEKDGVEHDAFLAGDCLITSGSPAMTVPLPDGLQEYVKSKMGAKGSVEGWRQVPEFYEEMARRGHMWGVAGLAMSFGAPLMKMMPGNSHNPVVSFWSSGDGTGKTTLLQAMASVWGHCDRQLISADSPDAAIMKLAGRRHNLPVLIDDSGSVADRRLPGLISGLANGRGKDGLTDGGEPEASRDTITCMTADADCYTRLKNFARGRDAEVKRVLDIEVTECDMDFRDANRMISAMQNNYGVAGQAFIQKLMDSPEIFNSLPSLLGMVEQEFRQDNADRFRAAAVSCALVGAELAKRSGLLDYDTDRLRSFLISQSAVMRGRTGGVKRRTETAFSDYLAESIRDTLTVATPTLRRSADAAETAQYLRRTPGQSGELGIRIELSSGKIYVRRGHLLAWCKRNGLPVRQVLPAGAIKREHFRLGRSWLGADSDSMRCWEISCDTGCYDVPPSDGSVRPGEEARKRIKAGRSAKRYRRPG